ncbi:carbamoyltransferase [Pseudaestuariivita rosea]|uniref:carbamoyltransferase family protein n=1 Tax=Pseudaestuariivita rosea TaxID=2763263 RepID=UPI001ABB2577|nr:carbamoyltransferase C-terminal domain-containing protein [Pseudaestuariivita rosea]
MIILGINSFFEHPAVALLKDGELVFAIEDERLTRVKHGRSFSPYSTYVPYASIFKALEFADIKVSDIDQVAYSYDPWRHLIASLHGCMTGKRILSFRGELNAYMAARNVKKELSEGLTLDVRYLNRWGRKDFQKIPFKNWDHHLSHAASTFFCSGFESSLVVVSDGSGENACTSVYVGEGSTLKKFAQIDMPNSLGLLYSFVTGHLGFQPFGDEYKVMGLAAFGKPTMKQELNKLVHKVDGGRYTVDFERLKNLTPLLGLPRRACDPIEQRHKDLARSLQSVFEDTLMYVVAYHMGATRQKNLCVAGGTFLNCVANYKLLSTIDIDGFFAQPAAHDAGTAIGAAALSWVAAGGQPQIEYDSMLLGTEWSDQQIGMMLKDTNLSYRKLQPNELASTIGDLLAKEYVTAYFGGRMEFGPRALGARSFLASPRSARTQERLNIIKAREQFRPLAPLVREQDYDTYFEGRPNRYMMLAVNAKPRTHEVAPAIVHADGTSRVQIVRKSEDHMLHSILSEFHDRTGIPILVNTSLNTRGRPIDESPVDAIATAFCSGVDYLVLGSYLIDTRRGAGQDFNTESVQSVKRDRLRLSAE